MKTRVLEFNHHEKNVARFILFQSDAPSLNYVPLKKSAKRYMEILCAIYIDLKTYLSQSLYMGLRNRSLDLLLRSLCKNLNELMNFEI